MRHIAVLLHIAKHKALFETTPVASQSGSGKITRLLGVDHCPSCAFAGSDGQIHAAHNEAQIDAQGRSITRNQHAVCSELFRHHVVAAFGDEMTGIFEQFAALNQGLNRRMILQILEHLRHSLRRTFNIAQSADHTE